MEKKKFIQPQDLEVYKLARELSRIAWRIYIRLDWRDKKIMGDQFIEATDSIGANIIEGYLRYHFLERIRFYYIARSSLAEAADHWLELLEEREKVHAETRTLYKSVSKELSVKLHNLIVSTYKAKGYKAKGSES